MPYANPEDQRQWRLKNKERAREYQREYRKENKEALSARAREYRKENGEALRARVREYRKENGEALRARVREYRKENLEAIREYQREYRKENKEAITNRARQDRIANPEKYRKYEKKRNATPKRKAYSVAASGKRRVKKLGNKAPKSWGPVDQEKIKEIYRLSAWLTKNRKQNYAVDHIIPVSRGGAHHQKNLRVLTENTNGRKGNKLDSECDFDIFYWVWETVRN